MKTLFSTFATVAVLGLAAAPALAEEHVVRMLNKGEDGERMVFEPAVIQASTGDTVRFVPEDKGHNAASVRNGLPDGAEAFRGGMNTEVVYEVGASGLHVIQCTPHLGMGMIALVVSDGDLSNLEEVREKARLPGKADDRFEAYLEQAFEGAAG